MEAINSKLDKIIGGLRKLENRMDLLEKCLDSNTSRLTEIEDSLNLRCDAIELELKNTVKKSTFENLEKRLNLLETSLQNKSTKFRKLSGNVRDLSKNLAQFQNDTTQELLEKEIYAKRFNILIHDIEENLESAWETKWESEKKVREFLHECLKIPRTHVMAIADVHRLPQHNITKNDVRITRPIIVKLTSYLDKNLIMRSLKNLKPYNEERKRKFGNNAKSAYLTEHLPQQLQQQKKKLLSTFKEAREAGKKAFWRIERATYCLYIDNVKYRNDNSASDDSSSDSSANSE